MTGTAPSSPYLTVKWPENVHIFTQPRLETMEWPEKIWCSTVRPLPTVSKPTASSLASPPPPTGSSISACSTGRSTPRRPGTIPSAREEIAASGLAYLALGHIHKRAEPLTFGGTVCAWPGCPEGRGFDELGEKGFYSGTIDDSGKVSLTFVPFARRRYEILTVDVTDQDPRAAIEAALPADTAQDLYRILLTGETGEGGVHTDALKAALADRFYALELRDRTRLAEDLWAKAEEDSLRGLFLRDLKQQLAQAQTEEDRQRVTMAARFGLAALDPPGFGIRREFMKKNFC